MRARILPLASLYVCLGLTAGAAASLAAQLSDYRNQTLSFERRAADLVARMTLEEKASQIIDRAPAIERLGVPEYN